MGTLSAVRDGQLADHLDAVRVDPQAFAGRLARLALHLLDREQDGAGAEDHAAVSEGALALIDRVGVVMEDARPLEGNLAGVGEDLGERGAQPLADARDARRAR